MAATTEPLHRSSFATNHHHLTKPMPILTTTSPTTSDTNNDAMEITPTSASMPPPTTNTTSSPASDKGSIKKANVDEAEATSQATSEDLNVQPTGAAAAANQPTKVVQTAFIHKLYNMLEDQSIQHLICWSKSNESFVMNPSQEFSKVLAQYFKHTNISSFVRQLNMYGFHKISDVFHNGAPDNTLWEFKHGNGSFKRGDLASLKEIKRRASRHTLIHRESFSTGAKTLAPADIPDPNDRFAMMDHFLNDINTRLARTEDTVSYLKGRCQMLSDGLIKSHQWNQELAQVVQSIIPDPNNPIHQKINTMQRELSRQTDSLRNGAIDLDYTPPDSAHHFQSHLRQPQSPRQPSLDIISQRRPSHPFESPHHTSSLRPASNLPPHLTALSPRPYGSIGSATHPYSPRGPPTATVLGPTSALASPAQSAYPPTSAGATSPPSNLSRRHTAADIRSHGWDNTTGGPPPLPSPFSNYTAPGSSPLRGTTNANDSSAALREHFASYEMRPSISKSRTPPPPPPHISGPLLPDPQLAAIAGTGPDAGWVIPGPTSRPMYRGSGMPGGTDSAGPATRRSSVVTLHGLLNPTAIDGGASGTIQEEDGSQEREGKRKRVE